MNATALSTGGSDDKVTSAVAASGGACVRGCIHGSRPSGGLGGASARSKIHAAGEAASARYLPGSKKPASASGAQTSGLGVSHQQTKDWRQS
jgi:hypothetical protein